jgi:ribosome-associated heat shock protein Hsp15
MRLDKWLWAARFYKTRSIATDEISKGRVQVNGQTAKPSKELRIGDTLQIRQGQVSRTLQIKALAEYRGPAPVAQALYEESPESMATRLAAAELRRLSPEPASHIEHGRPTKKDRRQLDHHWDSRWTAQVDPSND